MTTEQISNITDYLKPIAFVVLLLAAGIEATRRIEAAEAAAIDAARRVTAVESDVREISTDVRWIRRAMERQPVMYQMRREE